MKNQLLNIIASILLTLSLPNGSAQETSYTQAPVSERRLVTPEPKGVGGPLDPTAADFGIADKMTRSDKAEGSADRHYEKGMLYKRAGNHLYNQSRYKQAYQFYLQAEAELQQAAEKCEQDGLAESQNPTPRTQNRAASAAYYHLGLVSEKIRNDKSVAAACFAKARELDPSANHLALKLARTKEGRARLGVRSSKDFERLKNGGEEIVPVK